jgi:hypothetical protein
MTMTLRALSPDWERKTWEVMPSAMGVQLRYGPMRMPELGGEVEVVGEKEGEDGEDGLAAWQAESYSS